jgi:hypothetical protein
MNWRTADPDDRTTWPPVGEPVIIHLSADGYTRRWAGIPDFARVGDVIFFGGLRWSASDAIVLRWVPWSELGDPDEARVGS